MSAKESKLKVSKFLEYAIFRDIPLHVTPANRKTRPQLAKIVDVGDVSFVMEVPNEKNTFPYQIGERYHFVGSFNQDLISFSSQILERVEQANEGLVQLTMQTPVLGLVKNLRLEKRFALGSVTDPIHNRVTLEDKSGKLRQASFTAVDISNRFLCIAFPRDQGFCLPGDRVTHIQLSSNGNRILEASGRVSRIELNEGDFNNEKGTDEVLAVISLEKAVQSKKPNGDRKENEVRFSQERIGMAEAILTTPLRAGSLVKGQISAISPLGMELVVRSPKTPVPVGLNFPQIEIFLPSKRSFTCNGYVSSVIESAEPTDKNVFHVKVTFHVVSADLNKAILELWQTYSAENVHDLSEEDQEDLWQFLFETGFIYQAKRKQLQTYGKAVIDTYKALLTENNSLVKKIVYRQDDRIKGHLSAVRLFDNTWIIQHLNALKTREGMSAAQAVLKSMAGFFMDSDVNKSQGTSYIVCFYRPNNLYPTMLFGEVKEFVNSPDVCDFKDLRFCLLSETIDKALATTTGTGRDATDQDLGGLERLLISQRQFQLIRIEGLTREGLKDMEISKQFEKLGLYRNRKVLVATDDATKALVYAVCNFSSPGLNLSELTNSVRLFFSGDDAAVNQKLADQIMPSVLDVYNRTQIPGPVLLLEGNQPVPSLFEEKKTYRYWYFDAEHGSLFREGAQRVFDNLRQNLAKYLPLCEEKKVA